ncbi:MAG: Hsp70 family protein [Azospirillaceae bacterium]
MAHCGLDFGTSNSAVAVARNGRARLIALESGGESGTESRVLPSALFFDDEATETVIGGEAMARYLDGVEGRLMRSLKSILGTELMDDATLVHGHSVAFTDILAGFLRQMKARAEAVLDRELDQVVHGRPVHFHDRNKVADEAAAATLERVAKAAGFREVVFQFEPIAAAAAFEETLDAETLVLVADIGGGTSDFSVARLDPRRGGDADRSGDILAAGGIRLGGTDLDRLLSLKTVMPHLGHGADLGRTGLKTPNWIYQKLATWAEINHLYTPETARDIAWLAARSEGDARIARLVRVFEGRHGHRLAAEVETAKVGLSDVGTTAIAARYAGFERPLPVSRGVLERAVAGAMARLTRAAGDCVSQAGLAPADIAVVMFTGGTTYMPLVRQAIAAAVPDAQPLAFDQMGAVASGLAISAERLFG